MTTRRLIRAAMVAATLFAVVVVPAAAATAATADLPGVGNWATARNAYAQITVARGHSGKYQLTEEYTSGFACTYPDIVFRVDPQLRSADVKFTGPGHCNDARTFTASVFLTWRSTSANRVGAHGVSRKATLAVCRIANPTDCTRLRNGAIGLGAA